MHFYDIFIRILDVFCFCEIALFAIFISFQNSLIKSFNLYQKIITLLNSATIRSFFTFHFRYLLFINKLILTFYQLPIIILSVVFISLRHYIRFSNIVSIRKTNIYVLLYHILFIHTIYILFATYFVLQFYPIIKFINNTFGIIIAAE